MLLLVPDAGGEPPAGAAAATLRTGGAIAGPTVPWLAAARRRSTGRSARSRLGLSLDTEEHLGRAGADRRRGRARRPAGRGRSRRSPSSARPTAEKLTETLRSWLLHHGRREDIADELFVHPQTVRYRMGQLRDVYGDRLDDPATVLELTIALGAAQPSRPSSDTAS